MSASQPDAAPAPAFCLSLHIRHPSLDPQHISRELECEPVEAFGAGEPRRRPGAAAGVHGETYWAARLEPLFWRATGYLRTFDLRPALEPAAPTPALPADRRSRLALLIARGRQQGYLTHAELRQYVPEETCEHEALEDLARTLGELGIPVHEQTSAALAAIRRLGAVDMDRLRAYVARHASLQLNDVLALVSLRLATRHAPFLARVRAEGGSVRLLVTLAARAVHGLTIAPELGARLGQLGVALELSLASAPARARSRAS
jgi:hypothetical protein